MSSALISCVTTESSKGAELEAERWAGQRRKLQAEADAHSQEISQLKQDGQRKQETINRCDLHHLTCIQRQRCDSDTFKQPEPEPKV